MIFTLVISDALWSVSLIVTNLGAIWAVDGDLEIICAQAMTMGVRIREQSPLNKIDMKFTYIIYMLNVYIIVIFILWIP